MYAQLQNSDRAQDFGIFVNKASDNSQETKYCFFRNVELIIG